MEPRNYVRAEQTDLLYADAKDLIQSRRIYIRVASLYLLSLRHLSPLLGCRRISYINIDHLFTSTVYQIIFSPVCQPARVSSSEVKYDIFRNADGNLAEAPRIIITAQDR